MNNKSEKLNNFENKVKYVTKDWIEIFEDVKQLLKTGWNLGFDISKAIIQTISLWEIIPSIPEVVKIGKYLSISLSFIKKLKFLKWFF